MTIAGELPFPVSIDRPESWPTVCLAEVWQPDRLVRQRPSRMLPYRRRLFAAQDWQTIWPRVDRCSLYDYNRRPVAITRYETTGPQLPLLLHAIELGLSIPRLYALDGLLKPHQLQREQPSGALPLLGASGTWISQNWSDIRQIWQQQDTDHLRGLGFVAAGTQIGIQPIPHDSLCTDRRAWATASAARTTDSDTCVPESPLITEAALVARAIRPYKPHYRLNRGILEKLRLHARKDRFAPKSAIKGRTLDCSRPQFDWLVVLPSPALAPAA